MENYRALAMKLQARRNCEKSGNQEWIERHQEGIDSIMKKAPSGSGFDSGTTLNDFLSNENKLVLNTSFHHMNGDGYYDGWTEHTIIVTPSLIDLYIIRVTGRNRNDIKDYIADVFAEWLTEEAIS